MKLKTVELEGMTDNELRTEVARLRAELAAAQASRQQDAEAGAREAIKQAAMIMRRSTGREPRGILAEHIEKIDPVAVARAALQTLSETGEPAEAEEREA